MSFVSFGILEHYRPYKSPQTMKYARLAEINLFSTISFILLMEIDLDGEPLSYAFYDIALLVMNVLTSSCPVVVAICVSLARIFRLIADNNPAVQQGDTIEVIEVRGPQQAKCLHSTGLVVSVHDRDPDPGNVLRGAPGECTSETLIQVKVTPRSAVLDQSKRAGCRRAEIAVRTCQQLFCCSCVEGRYKTGQLQIGAKAVEPVVLHLQRSQVRKIVSKKKVVLELCKICIYSIKLAREAEASVETSGSIENRAKEAKDDIEKPHSDDMPETEISNADFAKALTTQLKPVLQPQLAARGLVWEVCLPYIHKVCHHSLEKLIVVLDCVSVSMLAEARCMTITCSTFVPARYSTETSSERLLPTQPPRSGCCWKTHSLSE